MRLRGLVLVAFGLAGAAIVIARGTWSRLDGRRADLESRVAAAEPAPRQPPTRRALLVSYWGERWSALRLSIEEAAARAGLDLDVPVPEGTLPTWEDVRTEIVDDVCGAGFDFAGTVADFCTWPGGAQSPEFASLGPEWQGLALSESEAAEVRRALESSEATVRACAESLAAVLAGALAEQIARNEYAASPFVMPDLASLGSAPSGGRRSSYDKTLAVAAQGWCFVVHFDSSTSPGFEEGWRRLTRAKEERLECARIAISSIVSTR